MSKASEWASQWGKLEGERPDFSSKAKGGLEARVTEGGHLKVWRSNKEARVVFSEECLPFAHWIIDTFGEGSESDA